MRTLPADVRRAIVLRAGQADPRYYHAHAFDEWTHSRDALHANAMTARTGAKSGAEQTVLASPRMQRSNIMQLTATEILDPTKSIPL
eukprot:276813-Rhodomonas_salina.1